ATLAHMRRLAERLAEAHLASVTGVVMYGIAASGGGLAVPMVGEFFLARVPERLLQPFLGCTELLGGLGVVVFGVWLVRLIDQYRTCLSAAAAYATATWASEEHTST